MYTTNQLNATKDLETLISMALIEKQTININTNKGNVLLLSEEDYNSLIETAYLCSNPKTKQTIIDGLNTPISECEELNWDNI